KHLGVCPFQPGREDAFYHITDHDDIVQITKLQIGSAAWVNIRSMYGRTYNVTSLYGVYIKYNQRLVPVYPAVPDPASRPCLVDESPGVPLSSPAQNQGIPGVYGRIRSTPYRVRSIVVAQMKMNTTSLRIVHSNDDIS